MKLKKFLKLDIILIIADITIIIIHFILISNLIREIKVIKECQSHTTNKQNI